MLDGYKSVEYFETDSGIPSNEFDEIYGGFKFVNKWFENPNEGLKIPYKISNGIYTGSDIQEITDSLIFCKSNFPNRRLIKYNLNLKVECIDERSIKVAFYLKKIKNKDMPITIDVQKFDLNASYNPNNNTNDPISKEFGAIIEYFDNEISDFKNGIFDEFRYYLEIETNCTNSTVTVQSDNMYNSWKNYIELKAY